MINVSTLYNYFLSVAAAVGIKKVIPVASEADFGLQVKNLASSQFPVMIMVIPSADSVAPDADNIIEVETILLYVMQKVDSTGNTPEKFMATMGATQTFMQAVKQKMLNDRYNHNTQPHIMHRLDVNAMHTDPEYNYFGCDGWSLSFTLQSPHF